MPAGLSSGADEDDGRGCSVHVIVSTHVAQNLALVLRALAAQEKCATTLSVTVDGARGDIATIAAVHAATTGQLLLLTQRASDGVMRLAQTRNNAVRALLQRGYRSGVLLFLDGDIVAAPDTISTHARVSHPERLTLGRRVNLTEEQSLRYLAEGTPPTDEQLVAELARLGRTSRQTNRQIWLRRLGLGRAHKPNIIGAHFAIGFGLFCALNGFDEAYQGYGCEDDDLARRAYAAGGRATNAILATRVYHLYHRSRAAARRRDNPGGLRFQQTPWTTVCASGLRTPLAQNPVTTDLVGATRQIVA